MVLEAGGCARPQAESGCGRWALVGLNKDKVSVSFQFLLLAAVIAETFVNSIQLSLSP